MCMLCKKGTIQGYISRYVIFEAKKNATLLLDQKEKKRLNFLLLQCHMVIVDEPSDKDIRRFATVIERKDSPILAVAEFARVDYLLTLNTKDFMGEEVKKSMKPIHIVTPKDFLKGEKWL